MEKILKSFKPKKTLNKKLFKDNKIDKNVLDKLLQLISLFLETIEFDFFIYDVILTGSIVNYNWSSFSDIDLHLVVDFEEISKKQKIKIDLIKDYFGSKKIIWNEKYDIKIFNYETEIYVQDLKEKHSSSGVYSLLKNNWLIEPKIMVVEINEKEIIKDFNFYKKKIENIKSVKESDKLFDELKTYRRKGIESVGEFSIENLVFKMLRRSGVIGKLFDKKIDIVNKYLSL